MSKNVSYLGRPTRRRKVFGDSVDNVMGYLYLLGMKSTTTEGNTMTTIELTASKLNTAEAFDHPTMTATPR